MKRFIFSILMMANLAAHQATADVDQCKVQGSPWAVYSERLYVRGTDNHLREWQFTTKEGEEQARWYVTDLTSKGCGEIMSDPRYFEEFYFKEIKKRDKEGNLVLDETGKPVVDGFEIAVIERIVARGKGGQLLECQRRELFSELFSDPSTIEEGPTPQWQKSYLTEATDVRIAGTPSPLVSSSFFFDFSGEIFGFSNENTPQQFFTPTPDDHLLVWSLPRLSDDNKLTLKEILEADERKWDVKNLTTNGNRQTSAGNSNITVPSFLFDDSVYLFTRSQNGHLLLGWQSSEQEQSLIDLTNAVDGQPKIVGDPAGYGNIFRTAANRLLGLQYVFARGTNGHLLAWRHQLEVELEIPTEGYDDWRRQTIETGWNNIMLPDSGWKWELLDLTTNAMGGKTIAGDPTVYYTTSLLAAEVLNVLARSSEGHLLKWSTVLPIQREGSPSFNEKSEWKVEDLTVAVGGKQLIKGEPKGIEYLEFPTTIPESDDSPVEKFVIEHSENILVTDDNDHLLEWKRQWKEEFDEFDISQPERVVVQEDNWQVTDLTKDCQPADGVSGWDENNDEKLDKERLENVRWCKKQKSDPNKNESEYQWRCDN